MGVADDRLAEGADAVRDRLDPGHGGAAGREGAHHQPGGNRAERSRCDRRGDHGVRVSAARQHAEETNADQPQKAGDEDIGRQGEQQAGLAGAAQIGECDQGQNAEAQATV